MKVRCVVCRGRWTGIGLIVCAHCAQGMSAKSIDQLDRDFQQYRCLVHSRFSDSKRFYSNLRAGYRAAGFEEVAGPCAVRVIGQQSQWEHGVMAAGQLVLRSLAGLGIGEDTDVRSVSVTLLNGGHRWTSIECRGLLEGELDGTEGIAR